MLLMLNITLEYYFPITYHLQSDLPTNVSFKGTVAWLERAKIGEPPRCAGFFSVAICKHAASRKMDRNFRTFSNR
jgi:hypothetical protein